MTNEDILYSPLNEDLTPKKKGISCTDRDIILYLISRYRDGASPSQLFEDIESLSQKWDDVGETCVFGGRAFKHKDRADSRKRDRWATGLEDEPSSTTKTNKTVELGRRLRELLARHDKPVYTDPVIQPMQPVVSQGHWMIADRKADDESKVRWIPIVDPEVEIARVKDQVRQSVAAKDKAEWQDAAQAVAAQAVAAQAVAAKNSDVRRLVDKLRAGMPTPAAQKQEDEAVFLFDLEYYRKQHMHRNAQAIANEIVSVQPMSGPVNQIAELRRIYGNICATDFGQPVENMAGAEIGQ